MNALTANYIEANLENRWDATQKATEWISQQLQGLKIKLEKSEDELQQYAQTNGPRIAPFVCDVSNEEQVCITIEDIFTRFGPPHVLINNAGVLRDAALVSVKPGGIQTLSTTQWRSVIEVNLTGTFLATREVAERMIRTKTRGVIINMSSISRKGNAGQSSYAASKAAVAALVTTWARELSLFGIRVVGIAPGLVNTPLIDAIPPPVLQANIQRTPSRRLGRPEEIAAAVASVLDNDFVNGRTLEIDGGLEL